MPWIFEQVAGDRDANLTLSYFETLESLEDQYDFAAHLELSSLRQNRRATG